MKKLIVTLAIACMATSAFAAPMFSLDAGVAEPVVLNPGDSVWINVKGSAPTDARGFQGLDLFAALSGPFQVTGLLVDQAGSGTGFDGNSSGATMMFQDNGALAVVTTSSGYITTDKVLAKVQVKALASALPGETGVFTTDGTAVWGAASDFADGAPAVQDSLALVIAPEPVSALLLVLGLPFLRRRHA